MSGVGGCKYHVIQFLEVPYQDIAEYVCVPRSWVQSRGPGVPVVKVSYPVEKPSVTEERVMKLKKKSNSWKSFLSVMRYSTDNYENAKFYIQQQINNLKKNKGDSNVVAENIQDRRNKSEKKNGDHTLLSRKANEKTSISTQNAMSRATIDNDAFVVGMIDALGWCVSSKSENTLTLKRKALPDSGKENHNKRFRVNEPDESDDQVAGPSNTSLDSSKNHLPPNPEDSDEDLCIQETPVEKFNDNSTGMTQTVNQKPSKTTHSLDPKIIAQLATSPMFAKWCMLMQELQEVFDNSIFKELINKLLIKNNDGSGPQNNNPIASVSSDTTEKAPQFNKEARKEKSLEEKDTDNDDDDRDQPLENDDSSEEGNLDLDEDQELPPEYDANDSRLTLNYRDPAPRNVELMNEDNDSSAPQNNNPIVSASSNMTVEAPKLNKEKRNEKPLEEKDTDDDDDDKEQPLKKKSCPKLMKKFVLRSAYTDNSDETDLYLVEDDILPPEYDANDSRWTLRYREPAPGLAELMPHTGVFVYNSKDLCYFTRPAALAKQLLLDIFTNNALNICRLPGTGTKAIERHGTKVRPELDKHAITVLMNFVTDHAKKVLYPYINTPNILNGMRARLRYIRTWAHIENRLIKENIQKKNKRLKKKKLESEKSL